jgi:hypothetical protein
MRNPGWPLKICSGFFGLSTLTAMRSPRTGIGSLERVDLYRLLAAEAELLLVIATTNV